MEARKSLELDLKKKKINKVPQKKNQPLLLFLINFFLIIIN